MRSFEAGIRIRAGAAQVWQVLLDVGSYRDWNSGVDRVDGTVALGEKLVVHATTTRGRAFPVTVTELRPGEAMRWQGGLPLGLFVGERTFRLDRQADGSTEFVLREQYSGPLAPLLGRTIPDLNPSFRQFAAGLKARAEQLADQPST